MQIVFFQRMLKAQWSPADTVSLDGEVIKIERNEIEASYRLFIDKAFVGEYFPENIHQKSRFEIVIPPRFVDYNPHSLVIEEVSKSVVEEIYELSSTIVWRKNFLDFPRLAKSAVVSADDSASCRFFVLSNRVSSIQKLIKKTVLPSINISLSRPIGLHHHNDTRIVDAPLLNRKNITLCESSVYSLGKSFINGWGLIVDGQFRFIEENASLSVIEQQDVAYNSETREYFLKNPRISNYYDGSFISVIRYPADNYFHWLTEQLPRVWTASQVREIESAKFIFPVRGYSGQTSLKNFQSSSISALCIPDERVEIAKIDRNGLLAISNLYMPSVPLQTAYATRVSRALEPTYRSIVANVLKNPSRGRRIFISRADKVGSRAIANEREFLEFLTSHNFEIFVPGNESFTKQVEVFNSADIVVGVHGAALSNIGFMRPGTSIIEVINFEWSYRLMCYMDIAAVMRLHYATYIGASSNMNFHTGEADVVVDLEIFARIFYDILLTANLPEL